MFLNSSMVFLCLWEYMHSHRKLSFYMSRTYIYIYICRKHTHIYIYIYIYIPRNMNWSFNFSGLQRVAWKLLI